MMNSFDGFTKGQLKLLRSLKTPKKIQDFLNRLKINFEEERETCYSPKTVLERKTAHCIEGALLAAVALRLQGHKPLIVDLTANEYDDDHVVTVFKQYGHWGGITKTNHAVLRYREPIYKTVRELVLSYFHEYFTNDGCKNLRSYTMPINLARFDKLGWMTSKEDVWYIPEHIVDTPHVPLMNRAQIANLRRADPIERKAGLIVEWKNKNSTLG